MIEVGPKKVGVFLAMRRPLFLVERTKSAAIIIQFNYGVRWIILGPGMGLSSTSLLFKSLVVRIA